MYLVSETDQQLVDSPLNINQSVAVIRLLSCDRYPSSSPPSIITCFHLLLIYYSLFQLISTTFGNNFSDLSKLELN